MRHGTRTRRAAAVSTPAGWLGRAPPRGARPAEPRRSGPPRAWIGALLCAGCTSFGSRSESLVPTSPAVDLAARCEQAARDRSPLVTEWAASKKAHLEGLAVGQALAVAYSGCELRILEGCRPPGHYSYRRTTLATDTFEIRDADDLYAKLPLGAFGLQGELARSGRLSVRTTVAGQYQLDEPVTELPKDPSCEGATHVVYAMSVGAFSLLGGGSLSAGAGASTSVAAGGAKTSREESVVRQAGEASACGDGNDRAPSPMCASPIQVFLSPVRSADDPSRAAPEDRPLDRAVSDRGVMVRVPAPADPNERWRLYDAAGRALCELPCTRFVPWRSGYYVEREATSDREGVRIDVPNDLPNAPGMTYDADYGPERGMPFLSKLTFYGLGIPSAGLGVGLGIAYFASSDSDLRGFYLGSSIMYTTVAAASLWWFLYSDEKHFRMRATPASSSHGSIGAAVNEKSTADAADRPSLRIGPGFLSGTF